MFGFGIALMHIADFFTRRKYDKKVRISKSEEEYQGNEGKQCHTCGNLFDSEMALEDHIKRKHWEHKEQEHTRGYCTVKGTGSGIDTEIAPNLFSKFAATSEQGTGLGISKNII